MESQPFNIRMYVYTVCVLRKKVFTVYLVFFTDLYILIYMMFSILYRRGKHQSSIASNTNGEIPLNDYTVSYICIVHV